MYNFNCLPFLIVCVNNFRLGGGLFKCLKKAQSVFLFVVFFVIRLVAFTSIFIKKTCANESRDMKQLEHVIDEFRKRHHDAAEISVAEFQRKSKHEKWLVVDARPDRERSVSIIPDAISLEEFEQVGPRFKNTPILVYCTIGCRSGEWAEKLSKKGYSVFNLIGGILAWARAGNTFVNSNGEPTKKAHVYGRKWNALPPGYEAVW